MNNPLHTFKCKAPSVISERSFTVWNGSSWSYLAKSQMKDAQIEGPTMTFKATYWFYGIHPWLTEINE